MNQQADSRVPAHAAPPMSGLLGAGILAFAVLPAAAAVVMAVVLAQDPAPVARLLITAVVYAPVAVISLTYRRIDIAALTAALAVSSGWLAVMLLLRDAHPDASIIVVSTGVLHVSRIAEFAALSLLGWLVLRDRAHPYRVGIAFGILSPAMGSLYSVLTPFTRMPGWLIAVPFALALVSLVAAVVTAGWRWGAGSARERTAWWWFLIGAILTTVSYGRLLISLPESVTLVVDAAFVCAQGCLPVAVLTVVITTPPRQPVVQAIAVAQSLSFGVAAYLAVTGIAWTAGVETHLAGAVAAAALALVFGATVGSSRARVTTLLCGRVPDARELLGHLGARLDDSVGDGVGELAAALRDTWGVKAVEIGLDGGGHPLRAGPPAAQRISAGLRAGGRAIGSITVSSDDLRGLERIRPVLDQTTGLIAAAVLLAAVNEDVAATRGRTLDVRREERRLLHGELHDSVAPALAGIAFGLAAAQTLLAQNDPRWLLALRDLRDETATILDSVRRLARALLPTALDQGDLEGALTELGAAVTAEGLPVAVDAHGTDVLDVDVQLSLYLLLAEALGHARRATAILAVATRITLTDHEARVSLSVDSPSDEVIDQLAMRVRTRADELGATGTSRRGHVIETEFRR